MQNEGRESIYFNEEHDMLRAQIRRFVETEVTPNGNAWEEAGIPEHILPRMGELGFLGMRYPEAYGGAGLDTLASVVLAEEVGRSTYGGFGARILVHTDMASPHLAHFGNEAQLAAYMPDIISGKKLCAVAVTEPDAGSDVAGIKTRAVRDGDDWVLNGSKMFITNGVHADIFFIGVKTDLTVKGSRGISIFIVEKGMPGFSVGRALKKTGWLCSDTAELIFDECRVPAANMLGEENKGFYSIMRNFQNERIVLSAMAMGEAQKALELTLDYVKMRKVFGGVLWDKQTIRQRLAQRAGEVEAGRQLVYRAAWLDAQGRDCIREVSMAKAYCGELVNRVLYDCVQFHGGMGFIEDTVVERMARDARVQAIGGGATEVMLEEVAKRL